MTDQKTEQKTEHEKRIREALEAGPTEGVWHWHGDPVKGDPTGRVRFEVVTSGKTITRIYYSSYEAATVKLGAICSNVGAGFTMTALFVEQVLGIKPTAVDKAARLYTPTDERRIYAALRDHLNGLLMKQAA